MMHNHLFHQENLLLKMCINFICTDVHFTLVASFANGLSILPIWHIKHLHVILLIPVFSKTF